MEEVTKQLEQLSKEDLIRILGNLYNAGIQKDMLVGLGFKQLEAKIVDDIMESCEIICDSKYGWHIPNSL